MNDKFIKVEDMTNHAIIFRESDLVKVEDGGQYRTLTFADGVRRQVITKEQDIWIQLSQNQK